MSSHSASDPNPPSSVGDYLRNPLPPGPSICDVCRGPSAATFDLCFRCADHQRRANGRLADEVFLVSYAVRGGTAGAGLGAGPHQHYDDLKRYKNPPVVPLAGARLRDFARSFVARHRSCIEGALGGRITDLAVVPSGRRPGHHPLAELLGIRDRILDAETASSASHDRRFDAHRFTVSWSPSNSLARVLVLDDTWTTGASVQSFAHALKAAGALTVAAVVLGRLLNAEYEPCAPILAGIRHRPFDPGRCTSSTCTG